MILHSRMCANEHRRKAGYRKMVCDNILEYIGHTPMIRLNRMNDPEAAEVLVKFEGLNVGG